jgi:hypothetical protein
MRSKGVTQRQHFPYPVEDPGFNPQHQTLFLEFSISIFRSWLAVGNWNHEKWNWVNGNYCVCFWGFILFYLECMHMCVLEKWVSLCCPGWFQIPRLKWWFYLSSQVAVTMGQYHCAWLQTTVLEKSLHLSKLWGNHLIPRGPHISHTTHTHTHTHTHTRNTIKVYFLSRYN